jgi:hypothetical protein
MNDNKNTIQEAIKGVDEISSANMLDIGDLQDEIRNLTARLTSLESMFKDLKNNLK